MVEAPQPSAETPSENDSESSQGSWSIERWAILAVAIFFGIYVLIFLIGLVSSFIWPESAAGFFSYLRDLVSIGMSISIVAVVVAIGILVVQIARFVNLLRSEIKPIAEETKEAVKNVRVTTAFVQKHAVAPILRIQSFTAALLAFLSELIKVAKLLQKREDTDEDNTAEVGGD